MKIMVVGINASADPYAQEHFVQGARVFYDHIKPDDATVDFLWPERGVALVDQEYWDVRFSSETMTLVDQVDEGVYDGLIIWCMLDPCLRPARERLKIPVVGLLQASMCCAIGLGRRVSIITPKSTSTIVPGPRSTSGGNIGMREKVEMYGMGGFLASIRSTTLTGLDFSATLEEQREAALSAATEAVEVDGADVLILGCGAMIDTAVFLQERLGVPVIDPTIAAVRTLEATIRMGLTHSKAAYPRPNLELMPIYL